MASDRVGVILECSLSIGDLAQNFNDNSTRSRTIATDVKVTENIGQKRRGSGGWRPRKGGKSSLVFRVVVTAVWFI
jgi:hypothetical protein